MHKQMKYDLARGASKMKKTTLLRILGLALFTLGIGLLVLNKNQKDNAGINNTESIDSEITQEVSLASSGIQKPKLKDLIKKNLDAQIKSVQEKADNSSILLKPRSYTEAEINQMTIEEFKDLALATEANLPTVNDIRKLPPGALHHVPAPVIQAGKDLGLIKEILIAHPNFTDEANVLYENCSEKDELPQSVRALCLTNLIQNKKAQGIKLNLASYPKEIVELTKLVIDI